MQVLIDGDRYVKYIPAPTGDKYEEALNHVFSEDTDWSGMTTRQVFMSLIVLVWDEGEGFSGKRPWGNSGWQWAIRNELIRGGFIAGSLNGDEEYEPEDREASWEFISKMIECLLAQNQ